MMPNRTGLGARLPSALLMLLASISFARAQQNLSWDANGVLPVSGGTGNWDTTSPLWVDGGTFQAWNNAAPPDSAIFGATAGNVRLTTPITVHDMKFDVGGYLFPSVGAFALTFGGANPTITTDVGFTQFFFPLTGSTGFTKSGTGSLQLGGSSPIGYTGVTTVNAGTLIVSDAFALGNAAVTKLASNLVLNNGSTINFSSPFFDHNYTLTGGTVNLQMTGINTLVSGSPTLTASTTLNLNGTGTTGILSGNLANTGANILSVTKSDTGRAILSGNNSYTGPTTVTRGRLQLNSAGALSPGSNLVFNGAVGTGGSIELTSNFGNFTRGLGAGADQVQWLGDGGFLSSGSGRSVNIGGAGAMLTWGAGGFVPDGNRLILGTSSNNLLDFQNGIDLSGGVRAVQGDGGLITGHAQMSGILSGTGGINQVGNGFLELTAPNSYSGGTVMTSGILVVGSDGNLGDAAGTLTFNGGTLENTGAFTAGRSVTINAPGGTFRTDADLEVSGPIAGAGRLTKTGAATLALTGTGTYLGGTTISAGTLQLGNGGATGSIVGNVVDNGTFAIDRSDSFTFGGAISGTGGFRQIGPGTTLLTGSSTYLGATSVDAGKLVVNGSIVSPATVQNGAALGGTGTVGSLAVMSGGMLTPGNLIGTLTANGNITLNPGAIFEVEVNKAGQGDKVIVNGTVDLTGSVLRIIAAKGHYKPSTSYFIIDNDGSDAVVGTFGQVTTNLAFLTPVVIYNGGDGNDVVLTLLTKCPTPPTPDHHLAIFCSVAKTHNQRAVAKALSHFPTDNPLFLAVLNQTAEGAREAFDALSGEIHATLPGILADESRYARDAILGRLTQATYSNSTGQVASLGAGGPQVVSLDSQAMALGYDDKSLGAAPPAYGPGIAFWTNAFGAWGNFDGNRNAATADRNLGGFVSGMDARLSGSWRVGLATGASFSNVNVDARYSSADVETYDLGGYLGGMAGPLALRGGGIWAWNNVDTSRAVSFPGFFERQTASYDADTGQIFGEVAYPTRMGSMALEPFAGLAYVSVNTDNLREHGGNLAALTGRGTDEIARYSTLGLRVASTMHAFDMLVTPRISAAWQHAFHDVTPGAALAFASTGIGFNITGVPLAQDSALIDAGLDLALGPNTTAGVSYSGQFGDGVTDNAVKGRFTWLF
jgi:outer membrane autotransporter protein